MKNSAIVMQHSFLEVVYVYSYLKLNYYVFIDNILKGSGLINEFLFSDGPNYFKHESSSSNGV